MYSEPLTIERYESDIEGQGVLMLKGPLVTENLSPFQNAVRGEASETMIIDLTHVPYIDSAGLGYLVSTYVSCEKAGRRVVLTGPNKRVRRLFEITKVEPLFLIFPSLASAIETLNRAGQA